MDGRGGAGEEHIYITFPESSYGIVKRFCTVERWTRVIADRSGKKTLSVLDFGCGTGDHVTYPLALLGHRVLGVDFHEPSIEEARRRFVLPNLSFRTAQVDTLVSEGVMFDLIVCSEVLEHVYDPLQFLTQLGRMIRPHGGLIITTPNGYGAFEWLSSLESSLDRVGVDGLLRKIHRFVRGRLRQEPSRNGLSLERDNAQESGFLNTDSRHVQFFRLGDLESLFVQSGLRVVHRQARTLLCGPYADVLLRLLPGQQFIYRMNNNLADQLPMKLAADWMFLLQPDRNGVR